jgi:hypothetical protein
MQAKFWKSGLDFYLSQILVLVDIPSQGIFDGKYHVYEKKCTKIFPVKQERRQRVALASLWDIVCCQSMLSVMRPAIEKARKWVFKFCGIIWFLFNVERLNNYPRVYL